MIYKIPFTILIIYVYVYLKEKTIIQIISGEPDMSDICSSGHENISRRSAELLILLESHIRLMLSLLCYSYLKITIRIKL